MNATKHYFNLEFPSSFSPTDDGGIMVRDVPLMAEGRWVSMQGIETVFTAEVLLKCATDWRDNGVWLRHPGGAPRSVSDKVGAVRNVHYDASRRAVCGDLYLHQRTEASRDAAHLVQMAESDGGIKSVSAETLLELGDNGIVENIVFTGIALVEEGACETCKIPSFQKGETEMADENIDKPDGGKPPADEPADMEDGHEEEFPESAEPQIIEALVNALETVVPGIKEIVDGIIASSDDVSRANAMGKMEQALMACGGDKGEKFAKPETKTTDFEAELKALRLKVAEFEKTLNKAETEADPQSASKAETAERAVRANEFSARLFKR